MNKAALIADIYELLSVATTRGLASYIRWDSDVDEGVILLGTDAFEVLRSRKEIYLRYQHISLEPRDGISKSSEIGAAFSESDVKELERGRAVRTVAAAIVERVQDKVDIRPDIQLKGGLVLTWLSDCIVRAVELGSASLFREEPDGPAYLQIGDDVFELHYEMVDGTREAIRVKAQVCRMLSIRGLHSYDVLSEAMDNAPVDNDLHASATSQMIKALKNRVSQFLMKNDLQ